MTVFEAIRKEQLMLEMRPGRPEEVLAQKALWKAAFGDEYGIRYDFLR